MTTLQTTTTTSQLNPEKIMAAINASDGSQYLEAIGRIPQERDRFVKAFLGELPAGESQAARREFSALLNHALRQSAIFQAEYIWALAPILLLILADRQDEDRKKAAFDVAGNDQELIALIISQRDEQVFPSTRELLADIIRQTGDERERAAGNSAETLGISDLNKEEASLPNRTHF